MNLFVVYVGGKTSTSLIEVHDIHFACGTKIEDTYDQLKAQWWGTEESLHLDAWAHLNYVDNYNITLKSQPATNDKNKLFFIFLGGYDPNEFTELHKIIFIIAENKLAAKNLAKQKVSSWKQPHTDSLFEIDNCVNVTELLAQRNLYIHLEPSTQFKAFTFHCNYVPIGKSS